MPPAEARVDWVQGLSLMAGAGDPGMKDGLAVYMCVRVMRSKWWACHVYGHPPLYPTGLAKKTIMIHTRPHPARYAANASMGDAAFQDSDGDLLIVPQLG